MRRAVAGLLVAGLLVGACSSAATPQIIYITPEPTSTLAPTLKPAPTPAPTPASKPAATIDLGWAVFLDRISALDRFIAVLGAVTDDSLANDLQALALDYIDLEDWARTETSCLNAHPVGSCYETAWTHWRAVATNAGYAGATGHDGAVNADADQLARASEYMATLGKYLGLMKDDISVAAAACS